MGSERTQQFIQAYRNLTLSPLAGEEEIAQFWVPAYGENALARLRQSVLLAEDNGRIWFSGQRGCGKSTLLGQLAKQLRQEGLFVVGFSVVDMIEMSDASHIIILYAIAICLIERAQKQEVSIPPNIKSKLTAWFTHTGDALYDEQLAESQEKSQKKNQEKSQEAGLLELIKNKLKGESAFRAQIARKYEFRIDELVRQIDLIAAAIQVATGQPVVVIVDDLNKLPFGDFEAILREHAKALWSPNIRLVFVVPVTAAGETAFSLSPYFSREQVVLRTTQFFSRAQARATAAVPIEANVRLFEAVLQKRLPETLIESETARQMVLMSGGVMRNLIRLAAECCRECLMQMEETQNSEMKIDADIFQAVMQSFRQEMSRPLGSNLYDLLVEIYQAFGPPDARSDDFQSLLHGLYVLEYGEGEALWYDLSPIVKDLLRRRGLID
ncbi:MAG: ATP-binding protein [Cyanobacteria bacterium J06623_4]